MMITKRIFILAIAVLLVLSLGVSVLASVEAGAGPAQEISSDLYATVEGESAAPAAPVTSRARGSNTPLFAGAVLAVLMFMGVALYCKAKGNRTL